MAVWVPSSEISILLMQPLYSIFLSMSAFLTSSIMSYFLAPPIWILQLSRENIMLCTIFLLSNWSSNMYASITIGGSLFVTGIGRNEMAKTSPSRLISFRIEPVMVYSIILLYSLTPPTKKNLPFRERQRYRPAHH